MKNRIYTLCIREIKKSYKRFLSLVIMSFLGVSIFVGIQSAANVMLVSLDKYYDDNNVYDIKIFSTLGLTDEDVMELKNLDLIEDAYGSHTKDVIFNVDDTSYVIKLSAINNNINKIIIKEGKLPENNNEIVVEKYLLEKNNLKIGDILNITDPNNNIKNSELKIVGIVESPIYLLVGSPALMRGTSSLGTGQINFYAYVNDDLFDMEYYSEINLTVKGAKNLITEKEDYNELIKYAFEEINAIKKYREKARYDEIYNRIMNEISNEEKNGYQKLDDANRELNGYKKKLGNGLNELNNDKEKIENGINELNNSLTELEKAKAQIDDGYLQLENAKKKVSDGKKQINDELNKYGLVFDDILTLIDIFNGKIVPRENLKKLVNDDNEFKGPIYRAIDYLYDHNYYEKINNYFVTGLESIKNEIISIIPTYFAYYDEIVSFINSINVNDVRDEVLKRIIDTNKVSELKKYIPRQLPHYECIIKFMDNYIDSMDKIKTLFNSVIEINNAEVEIRNQEAKLNAANDEYNAGYQIYLEYKKQLENGLKELNKGYDTYYSNLNTYNNEVEKLNNSKIDFEKKISKAKEDINTLEIPTWYINTRMDYSDYSSYINVGGSIKKLANAFPPIFFIVAIFISIMSMSRMALEDRSEIGALKALGFSNFNIMTKYIIYALLATIIGGILGALFGLFFLTFFIWNMYKILYTIGVFKYYYDFMIIIIGIIIGIVCITGTTILTVKSIIKENAASLLRPKAPPSGKNTLLEKTYFWQKIKFSNKVTIRNVFRYKKRVLMTIIGIMGCTILLLTGYGIKDSIVNIPNKQFDEIMIYDDMVYYNNYNAELLNYSEIKHKVDIKLTQAKVSSLNITVSGIDDYKASNSIIKINSIHNNKEIIIEDDVIAISSKLAEIQNIKIGDYITIKDSNNKTYELLVTDIYENYINHNIFMNKNTYEKYFGNYDINVSYIKFYDKVDENKIVSDLMQKDDISIIISTNYTKLSVNNMLKSLDNVVLILISFSGLLSFVVLYNLSYINISERKREIASLKVLGFYNREVDNYIIKENLIITIIGILLGILLGKIFVDFIVNSIEIDLVKFLHHISLLSYIKTFMYMLSFTIIVCFIIHFTLKKINMIDSLKSVE